MPPYVTIFAGPNAERRARDYHAALTSGPGPPRCMIYVVYHRQGKLAGAVLAHTQLFPLVAKWPASKERPSAIAEIAPNEAMRIPSVMIGRVLGEAEIRELMTLLERPEK